MRKAKNDKIYLFKYFFHPFKSGNVTSGHGIEVTLETGPVSVKWGFPHFEHYGIRWVQFKLPSLRSRWQHMTEFTSLSLKCVILAYTICENLARPWNLIYQLMALQNLVILLISGFQPTEFKRYTPILLQKVLLKSAHQNTIKSCQQLRHMLQQSVQS